MKAQDFVSELDYQRMAEKIAYQRPFEFERKLKKFRIRFDSGTANDRGYYVGFGAQKCFGDYQGIGVPLEKQEYEKIFGSYENCTEFVGEMLQKVGCRLSTQSKIMVENLPGNITDCGQVTLF